MKSNKSSKTQTPKRRGKKKYMNNKYNQIEGEKKKTQKTTTNQQQSNK